MSYNLKAISPSNFLGDDAISSSNRIADNRMRGKKIPFIAAIDTTADSMVEVNGRNILYTKPWSKYFYN